MNYEIKFTRKRIKNIIIKVRKYGLVEVSVPYFVNMNRAKEFLELKSAWIKQRMQELLANQESTNQISFLGKNYELEFELGITTSFLLQDDKLIIKATKDSEKAKKILDDFYKLKSREIFSEILKRFCVIVGKDINALKLRKMTTRWGSCNTKKAYINLNTELVKKDILAIEAVIMHELTHLYHADHSKAFYNKLLGFMPDYHERIKLLKNNKEL